MTGVTYEQLLIFTTALICGIILCMLIGLYDYFKEKKQKKKTFLEHQKREERLKQEAITEMYVKKSVKPGCSISQQSSAYLRDKPRPSNDIRSVSVTSVNVSQDISSSGSGILSTIGTGIALGAGAAIGSNIVDSVMDSFNDDDTGDYD